MRIHGTGRWQRDAQGDWVLLGFRVTRFEVLEGGSLEGGSLRDAVTALRVVPGSGWRAFGDPLAELDELRGELDELH